MLLFNYKIFVMNYKKYFIVFIIAGALFSCKKYLDKSPLDSVNTSNFWKTSDDAIAGINGAYQPTQWPK